MPYYGTPYIPWWQQPWYSNTVGAPTISGNVTIGNTTSSLGTSWSYTQGINNA